MSRWKFEARANKIALGILIIAIAVFCILQAIGVIGSFTSMFGEVPIWKLILGIGLVAIVFENVFKLDFGGVFVPLGVIFMIFEKNIAFACGIEGDIINNWLVICCSFLLAIGFGFIFPKRRRRYKIKRKYKIKNGHLRVDLDDDDKIEVKAEDNDEDCDDDFDDDFDEEYGGDFGANTRYFDGATFKKGYVMTNMGATSVMFENADKYQGGAVLKVDCRMGAITIEVPDSWRVANNIVNHLGSISNEHVNDDPDAPVLTIIGKCSMGAITIE